MLRCLTHDPVPVFTVPGRGSRAPRRNGYSIPRSNQPRKPSRRPPQALIMDPPVKQAVPPASRRGKAGFRSVCYKIISKFAEYSLAIYIIHENSFIRVYLYRNIFLSSSFYNSSFLLINMAYTCIGILLICATIEFVRKTLFKITINKLIDKSKYLNKIISI